MFSFKQWLNETPTNCASGTGVRGFGDVTGNPAGDITSYAATNTETSNKIAAAIAAHVASLTSNNIDNVKAGVDADTKDNIMNKKAKK